MIEEPLAECYGLFMTGYTDVKPHYVTRLIEVIPRLKQLKHYKHCETFADFGEQALKDRKRGSDAVWGPVYDAAYKVDFDLDLYFNEHYRTYIRDNTREIAAIICGIREEYAEMLERFSYDLEFALDIWAYPFRQGRDVYISVLNDALAIAMLQIGVK
jgi:hypothetical protein